MRVIIIVYDDKSEIWTAIKPRQLLDEFYAYTNKCAFETKLNNYATKFKQLHI